MPLTKVILVTLGHKTLTWFSQSFPPAFSLLNVVFVIISHFVLFSPVSPVTATLALLICFSARLSILCYSSQPAVAGGPWGSWEPGQGHGLRLRARLHWSTWWYTSLHYGGNPSRILSPCFDYIYRIVPPLFFFHKTPPIPYVRVFFFIISWQNIQ